MRPKRILLADRIAHVFTHAVHGVSFTKNDLKELIQTLRSLIKDYQFRIKYYNFSFNHIHLIIQFEKDISCGWVMQLINGEIAKAYNRLHKRRGHLWRERYKDITIKTDGHLDTCLAYVALNKVKDGFIDSPEEDIFSSYHAYAHGVNDGITEPLDCYLERGEVPEERQADFRAIILACARILKDVRRGRHQDALEARATQAGIHLPSLIDLYEFEAEYLIKDPDRAPSEKRRAVFTREALARRQALATQKASLYSPRDPKARAKRLRERGIPLRIQRLFFADEAFLRSFVAQYYPWIILNGPGVNAAPAQAIDMT